MTNEGTQGKPNIYSEFVFSNEYLEKTAADHVEVWIGDIRLLYYSNDINVGISQQKIGRAFEKVTGGLLLSTYIQDADSPE